MVNKITNKIYNKTQYVQLQGSSKPRKFYTIHDGVDGDILQVWMEFGWNTTRRENFKLYQHV